MLRKSWILMAIVMSCSVSCTSMQSRSKGAEPAYSGPIIDVHMHVEFDEAKAKADSLTPDTPENVLTSIQDSGVARAGVIVMAERGKTRATKIQNDSLLELVKRNPKLFAIGSVHPFDGEPALREMKRLADLGVKVIKLHPNTQKFDVADPSVEKVVKKAGELGLVLLFDSYSISDASQTGKFLMLAVKNPKTKFILAHMGGPKFSEMIMFNIAAEYPWYAKNVWFDLSWTATKYSGSPYSDDLLWVSRQIGIDRILFGSDFPIVKQALAIEKMRTLGFTREEQEKIFYSNAAQLLGL